MKFDDLAVSFNGSNLRCKLCDDHASRQLGMMGIEHLDPDCGVFFDMGTVGPVSFWMKNTLVPLDIVALDEQMNVLQVGSMEPHVGKFSFDGPVRYVVEANRGWCQAHGVGQGCRMMISSDRELAELVESRSEEHTSELQSHVRTRMPSSA